MLRKCWPASGDCAEYDVLIRVDKDTVLQAQSTKLLKVSRFFADNLKEKVEGKYLISINGIPKESFEVLLNYVETGHLTLYQHNVADVYYAAHKLSIPFVVKKCLEVRAPGDEVPPAKTPKSQVAVAEEPPLLAAATAAEVQSAPTRRTSSAKPSVTEDQHDEQRTQGTATAPSAPKGVASEAVPEDVLKDEFFEFLPAHEVHSAPSLPRISELPPRQDNFLDVIVCHFPLLGRYGKGLPSLSLEQVIDLLSEEDLGTCCEIPVFMAALLWLDGDYGSRCAHARDVLSCVRFTRMTADDLLHCFFPPIIPDIMDQHDARLLLLEACCYYCARLERRSHLFPDYAPKSRRKYARGRHRCHIWPLPERQLTSEEDLHNCLASLREAYLLRREPQSPCPNTRHWTLTTVYSMARMMMIRHRFLKLHYYDLGPEDEAVNPRIRSYGRRRYAVQKLDWVDNVWSRVAFSDRIGAEDAEPVIVLLGGMHRGHKDRVATGLAMARMYPRKKMSIKRFSILPRPLFHHKAAICNGTLYIVGGMDIRQMYLRVKRPSRACFAYHFSEDAWTRVADLNLGRVFHDLIVCQEKLFAIGGQGADDTVLSSVERYDPATDTWSIVQGHFCCPRMATGAVLARGALLVVAGGALRGEQASRTVYVTDEVNGVRLPDMAKGNVSYPRLPSPRLSCSAVTLPDGTLVILGGLTSTGRKNYSSISDVLALRPGSNQWNHLPSLPNGRHGFSAVAVEKDIFVFGGATDAGLEVHRDILVLHWQSSQWDTWGHLPGPLVGMQAVLLQAKDFFPGERSK